MGSSSCYQVAEGAVKFDPPLGFAIPRCHPIARREYLDIFCGSLVVAVYSKLAVLQILWSILFVDHFEETQNKRSSRVIELKKIQYKLNVCSVIIIIIDASTNIASNIILSYNLHIVLAFEHNCKQLKVLR